MPDEFDGLLRPSVLRILSEWGIGPDLIQAGEIEFGPLTSSSY